MSSTNREAYVATVNPTSMETLKLKGKIRYINIKHRNKKFKFSIVVLNSINNETFFTESVFLIGYFRLLKVFSE